MKKIYVLLVVMTAILFLFSCSQVAKNGYTIQGDDSLYVGETGSYSIKSRLGSTEPSNITWKISDNSIATLNNRGELTSLAEGVVTIFASFIDRDDTVSLKKDINITTLGQPDKGDEDVDFLIIGPEKLYKGQQTQLYIASLNSAKVDSVKWVDDGQGLVTFADSVAGDIEVLGDSGEVVIKATVSSGGKEYEVSKTFPLYNGGFVLKYKLDSSKKITLPFLRERMLIKSPEGSSSKTVPFYHDFMIDWGDGQNTQVDVIGIGYPSNEEDPWTHVYTDFNEGDEVAITITGDTIDFPLNTPYGRGFTNNLVDIVSWGNARILYHYDEGTGIFASLDMESFSAEDFPQLEGSIEGIFSGSKGPRSFPKNLGDWDMSNVTNMSKVFYFVSSPFSIDISGWDVSNVTDMSSMFAYSSFNGDLSGWDVSNVTDMSSMFEVTFEFTGAGLDSWTVHPLGSFYSMFSGASQLDVSLDSWFIRGGLALSDPNTPLNKDMFMGSGLNDRPEMHPRGCTDDCGTTHAVGE